MEKKLANRFSWIYLALIHFNKKYPTTAALALPIAITAITSILMVLRGTPSGPSHTLFLLPIWLLGFLFTTSRSGETQRDIRSNSFLNIILFQVFLFALLEFSSLTQFFIPGASLSITNILLGGAIILFGISRKSAFPELNLSKDRYFASMTVFVCISFVLFGFEFQEIPRKLMLSSDPDIHAFHAKQILRFGAIPWSQQHWGPLSLQYPAAFAGLNAIWAKFSFQDPRNTVTMQPMIQMLLGVGAILEFLALGEPGKSKVRRWKIFLFAGLMAIFLFRVFPYGRQLSRYHLEGTGRLAMFSFFTFLILLSQTRAVWRGINDEFISKCSSWWTIFSGILVCCFLVLINPGNFVPAAGVFGGVFLIIALRKPIHIYSATFFGLFASALLTIMDPYFFAFFGKTNQVNMVGTVSQPEKVLPISEVVQIAISRINTWENFSEIGFSLSSDFLPASSGLVLSIVCFCALLINAALAWHKKRRLNILLVSVLFTTAMLLVFIPFFSSLSGSHSSYLLKPYAMAQTRTLTSVLIVFTLAYFLKIAIFKTKSWTPILIAAAFILLLTRFAPRFNSEVRYAQRVKYQGSLGAISPDDENVIKSLEGLYREFLATNKEKLTFERTPKILVPNSIVRMGLENWLFPNGGARSLFAHEIFPLAFFYFQGSSEFSFENYKKHVCDTFDDTWLQKRNVRYLFLPSDSGPVCIANRSKISENYRLIASSGNAELYDLSPIKKDTSPEQL